MAKDLQPKLLSERKLLEAAAPKVERVAFVDIIFPEFQRYVNETRVRKLHESFDPHKVRRPLLNRRADGTLIAVDGQHTVRMLESLGFIEWECDVTGMDRVQEVIRFADQHEQVRSVSNLDRLYALSLAYDEVGGQKNTEVVRAKRILDAVTAAGWRALRGQTGKPDCKNQMTLHTSTGVEEIYDIAIKQNRNGSDDIKMVLTYLEKVWPNESAATEPNMIRAFGKLNRAYGLQDSWLTKLANPFALSQLLEKGKGKGGQSEKRDCIAEHARKSLGLTAKGEFRKPRGK